MAARSPAAPSVLPAATGIVVGLAGSVFVAVGLWGRREVRQGLARERIAIGGSTGAAVESAGGARSVAELIRRNTLAATGGRTYAEVEPYVDADGHPTSDASRAAKDERTGAPLEHPDHALWLQSTTLQTALMQAYVAFRVSELTIAIGASLGLVGLGSVAAARRTER